MDLTRQADLVSGDALATPITVIGCGGIGSFTALALAKLGCRSLTLYDPDSVEAHNLPNQLYRMTDVGRPKAEALGEILRSLAGTPVEARVERLDGQRLQGLVIAAVDTMEARKIVWQRSVRHRAAVPLYLDGRMGAEVARLYTIRPADPDDVRFYEGTLYPDAEAEAVPCTAAAISYTGLAIGSLMGTQVKKFLMGEEVRREILWDLKTLTLVAA